MELSFHAILFQSSRFLQSEKFNRPEYELPLNNLVTLEIFNFLDQKVKTFLNKFQKADRYEVVFSAKGRSAYGGNEISLASGIYIYRMKVNDFITSKKMVLLK